MGTEWLHGNPKLGGMGQNSNAGRMGHNHFQSLLASIAGGLQFTGIVPNWGDWLQVYFWILDDFGTANILE